MAARLSTLHGTPGPPHRLSKGTQVMGKFRVAVLMRKRLALALVSGFGALTLAGCAAPAASSSSTTTGCTPGLVREIVPRFIDAFNRGDLTQLDRLVADANFSWYATNAPGERLNAAAQDRNTLIDYFAMRHRVHERLDLTALNITYVNEADGGFWFILTRSADDLAPTRYSGKGEIQCSVMPASISVWAMDAYPWSPIELLPWAGALLIGAIAASGLVLWRRRASKMDR
jgi:hypothetical protein